jgi:hypothetical protein
MWVMKDSDSDPYFWHLPLNSYSISNGFTSYYINPCQKMCNQHSVNMEIHKVCQTAFLPYYSQNLSAVWEIELFWQPWQDCGRSLFKCLHLMNSFFLCLSLFLFYESLDDEFVWKRCGVLDRVRLNDFSTLLTSMWWPSWCALWIYLKENREK